VAELMPASSSIVVPTIAGVDWFAGRVFSPGVTLADHSPPVHASAGPDGEVTMMPVVARADLIDPWRPPELSHANDERRL